MTVHLTINSRGDVDHLYLPRKLGEQGLLKVKQPTEDEKRALNDHTKKSRESF